jgi:hypothetical protein
MRTRITDVSGDHQRVHEGHRGTHRAQTGAQVPSPCPIVSPRRRERMENINPQSSGIRNSAEGTKRDKNGAMRVALAATGKENPTEGFFPTKRAPGAVHRWPFGRTTTEGIGWARSPDPQEQGVPENPPKNSENVGSQRATPEAITTGWGTS